MNHVGTRQLETERLILRGFTVDDAEPMYRNWASDDVVTKFLTWPTHESVEDSRTVLESWAQAYGQDNFYQWAIVLKELGNEPIGSIGAVGMNESVSSIHIGYCIGREWWHQGIVSEALNRLIDFFFDEVGANRIEANHDVNNPHSGMVMRKCGMRYEGTMRSSGQNNQGICDCCWHAILKSDRQASSMQ